MLTLITLLISLLGYGSPADFENFTEDELNNQIEMAQADADDSSDDGGTQGWDHPGVQTPSNGG